MLSVVTIHLPFCVSVWLVSLSTLCSSGLQSQATLVVLGVLRHSRFAGSQLVAHLMPSQLNRPSHKHFGSWLFWMGILRCLSPSSLLLCNSARSVVGVYSFLTSSSLSSYQSRRGEAWGRHVEARKNFRAKQETRSAEEKKAIDRETEELKKRKDLLRERQEFKAKRGTFS